MNAKDIMSTPVVITKGDTKLTYVKSLFARNKISSAPVLKDDGEIEGIITSSDLTAVHNEELEVRAVMSRKVHVCALTARVQDLANTMTSEGIHHIVVMDNGQVHGMVSTLDVIKGLLSD
jgi:CBS domain-containing protein